jgi:hypothetical protein
MIQLRGLLVPLVALSLALPGAQAEAQTTDADGNPCVCPVPPVAGRDRGGISGLLGLAALGLARLGSGVRSIVAEPVAGPVVAEAIPEAVPLIAGAPMPADTVRDTTEVADQPLTAPAEPLRVVAMGPPAPDAGPIGIPAPRTATQLPLLALLGLGALLTGTALRYRQRASRPAGMPSRRQRYYRVPTPVVILTGQPLRRRYRIR